MSFGGFHPYPRRLGGVRNPRLEVIHKGLNAQRGTGYSQERSSTVWVENHAIARAISSLWSTNQRLANQSDPHRMTDMLSRWEKIFAIPVPADATEAERREEVAVRMARIGQPIDHAYVYTEVSRVAGDFFYALEYIDLSLAVVHAPDGSYPWGTVVSGYPWYSTVAHILVRLQIPAGQTDAEFWRRRGEVRRVLDAILPIWTTYTVYREASEGTSSAVSGGPSAAGWFLDEPNLDILVFRV